MRGRTGWLLAGLLSGLVASGAAPRAARAQALDNSVAVVGGIYSFNEFQGDTDPVFGARWASFMSPSAGVGAGFDWIPIGNGVSGLGYDVDLVLRVPGTNRTEPFFTIGAGGMTFTGNGASNTYFAGILGGGVRTMVAERAGLRFEARDRIYHVPGDLINDFHFTGGVELYF